ncbi:hypothetical protein T459_27740 [Capsicum annuum]|uniref:Uncharacterized protein n=1 Tax=Capsicum annuum TaxID=4072 RepID=A0A2G2YET1_CAPAN|nr:hypothetical protein T459_27740 [Capsicum annuum]
MEDHVGNNTIYLNVHHSQTWILNNDDECRNVDDRVLWHKQYEKSIAERSARAQMAAAAKQTTNSNHEEPILKLFVVGFTLETRTSNEVWNIVAIIPVDKRMGSGNGGGSNGSSSSELIAEENFLKICNKLLLARGGELLKRTRKGT